MKILKVRGSGLKSEYRIEADKIEAFSINRPNDPSKGDYVSGGVATGGVRRGTDIYRVGGAVTLSVNGPGSLDVYLGDGADQEKVGNNMSPGDSISFFVEPPAPEPEPSGSRSSSTTSGQRDRVEETVRSSSSTAGTESPTQPLGRASRAVSDGGESGSSPSSPSPGTGMGGDMDPLLKWVLLGAVAVIVWRWIL